MVGVPGRSKGCHTCRKRKVACSLERPACSVCQRSARVCEGYQKERVFVTSIASSSSYGTPWRPDSYTKKARQESANNILTLDLGMSTSDQNLEKTAVRNQMIGGVLSKLLATRKSAAWHPDWVTDISSLSRPTVALEVASLSFYTARLSHGQDIQNELLAQTGLKLYIQGLQAVQRALSNPKLMYREETLAACMLLAMYEVFEGVGESRKAYLTHQNGLAKLIYHRGPEAHQTGLAHSVFLAFRSMSTFEAMMRKKTFVSESEWMTIPFAIHPKVPFHRLLDTLLKAPSLMDRGEDIARETCAEEKLRLCLDMAKTCWDIDNELECFYSNLKALSDGPLFWPVAVDNQDHYPFSFNLAFPESRLGTTLMLYWAALTILWSGMYSLYILIETLISIKNNITPLNIPEGSQPDFEEIASRINLPPLKHRTEFITLARNICRSVDFCIEDPFTLPIMIPPLSVISSILNTWPEFDPEIQFAHRALERIRKRGVEMARYFPEPVEVVPVTD